MLSSYSRKFEAQIRSKSAIGIFTGYGVYEKGYRILNPATQKVLLSRDVIFDENG